MANNQRDNVLNLSRRDLLRNGAFIGSTTGYGLAQTGFMGRARATPTGELFADDFSDGDLSEWDISTTSNADATVDNGRMRLRVYKCNSAIAERDLGDLSGTLTVSFDWENYSEWWYEMTDWHLLDGDGDPIEYEVVSGDDLVSPGYRGNRRGSVTVEAAVDGPVTLQFEVTPSSYCRNGDHADTYLWIDNVHVDGRSTSDLPTLVQNKRTLIEEIRSTADPLMLDSRAASLDERAEALLTEIEDTIAGGGASAQHETALERMLTAEYVTASATHIGKDPTRETAAKLTELLVMLAFAAVAKAAIRGAGRLGSVIAAKLDDMAATARRGVKRLSGRPILPASAKRTLDDIIDDVDRRVDDWLGENSDDVEAAGEEIVSGAGTINDVFGLLTGSVVNGLRAIKDFAVEALSVLFFDVYMTDDAEYDENGERTEPPGIGSAIDTRMDELEQALDAEVLEPAGADAREQAKDDRVSAFESQRDAFLAAMEEFDNLVVGASIAVLVLAAVAVVFYAISAILSASGIGLAAAAVLATAASYLVTIASGIGAAILLLTAFSVVLGFGFLDNRRTEHDETIHYIVNYETVGGSA